MWTLIDYFNEFDTTRWTAAAYPNYSAYYRPENVTVENGILKLWARREAFGGKEFSSAEISTRDKFSFTYGRAEARIRIPAGQGLWPVFWAIAMDWPPEIDAVEILGHVPTLAYFCQHWGTPENPQSQCSSWNGPDFSQDWHVFSIDWTPAAIVWRVDGIERHRYTENIPSVPLHLLLSMQVGGWAGEPDESTPFPSYLEIDYVRVWEMSVITDLQAVETDLRQKAAELVAQADVVAQTILDLRGLDDILDSAANVIEST